MDTEMFKTERDALIVIEVQNRIGKKRELLFTYYKSQSVLKRTVGVEIDEGVFLY